MRFTFLLAALFAFVTLSVATPIDNEQNEIEAAEFGLVINEDSDLDIDALLPRCRPRPCDGYCKEIGHVYGRCQFGNCHCKDK